MWYMIQFIKEAQSGTEEIEVPGGFDGEQGVCGGVNVWAGCLACLEVECVGKLGRAIEMQEMTWDLKKRACVCSFAFEDLNFILSSLLRNKYS